MYIEMLIIAIIVIYMFMVNGKIDKDNFLGTEELRKE